MNVNPKEPREDAPSAERTEPGAAPRSKHAERSEATRAALVAAARPLFAARGFAGVGTEEIVRAAGVTRGALYHQFADKRELFAAVFEQFQEELAQRAAAADMSAGVTDPLAALRIGTDSWLDACTEPDVQRIVLLDGPAVLGSERWREIGMRYGLGLVEAALQAAVDAGRLKPQPVRPLAHVLIGAVDEAALYVATSDDPKAARAEVGAIIGRLIDSLGHT
jgi:AcrR family transcriptional regulator